VIPTASKRGGGNARIGRTDGIAVQLCGPRGPGSGSPSAAHDPCYRERGADFHGKKRSNQTHVSVTDPDARLYRKGKGKEAKLCCMGHALMENRPAIDGRTKRQQGYAVSQKKRKRIEEAFGWGKTVGPIAKTMLRGIPRVGFQFTLTIAAYNLARLPRLLGAAAA
jgi:hypothetical protein